MSTANEGGARDANNRVVVTKAEQIKYDVDDEDLSVAVFPNEGGARDANSRVVVTTIPMSGDDDVDGQQQQSVKVEEGLQQQQQQQIRRDCS